MRFGAEKKITKALLLWFCHCFWKLYEMLIIITVHNKYVSYPIFTTFTYLQSSSTKSRWDRLLLPVSNKARVANKYWLHQGYQSVHDLLIKTHFLLNKAWAKWLFLGKVELCLSAFTYCSDCISISHNFS